MARTRAKRWNAFVEAAEAQGWKVWSHSRPDYTVTDPDREEGTLPGLLFTVAQPQDHAAGAAPLPPAAHRDVAASALLAAPG